MKKLQQLETTRLATELAKLDPIEEGSLAEEGMDLELGTWPQAAPASV